MDILQFLNQSYTSYHAVENVCGMLREKGFQRLSLGAPWRLKEGVGYYVTQNDSSVVAFKVGKNKIFNICLSHTDSPSFKVKGGSVVSANGASRLNTEKYGGGLLYTFFDRPLKVAGRLLCETEKGVCSRLVVSDYNLTIPSLAIHHNPTANDGFAVNLQNDTLPLFSEKETDLYKTLTDEKVLDADLYVVPATQAFFCGTNNEYLCSPRLDNLTSVFASVSALAEASAQDIAVVACLDSEEVGSGTRQGHPNFLQSVLCQIENALGLDEAQRAFAAQNGMALSVDNGHALHPAHPEKSDPKMFVTLNGGVVIKHHPNYATDGLTSALLKKLLQGHGIPVQDYYNRSDVRCGSTLGLVASHSLNVKTCDTGLAQLAMHSACETVGSADIMRMQNALKLFLSASFCNNGEGIDIN